MSVPDIVSRLADQLNPLTHDWNKPTPQSPFVRFFHSYPRFGRGRELDFAGRYILTIFLTAVPWLIVALICLVFGITINVCYGGIRRRKLKRDTDLISPGGSASLRRSVSSSSCSEDEYGVTLGRIAGGVILFNVALNLLGLAFVSNFHFKSGSLATVTVAESAALDISTDSLLVFSVIETILKQLLASRNPTVQALIAGGRAVSFDPANGLRAIQNASKRFREVTVNIRELVGHVKLFGVIAFWLVVAVYAVLFIGVMLLFSTAFEKRSSQVVAMSIYLVPFFISWLCVAIVTSTSIVAADMCVSLGNFQKIVLVQSKIQRPKILVGINTATNLFIRNNIQCPSEVVRGIPLNAVADALGQVLTPTIASRFLPLLYPGSSRDAQEKLRRWLLATIESAISCQLMTTLAAKLNYAFCSYSGPMLALFACWVSLILLALTLTVAYCLTQFTQFEASRFLTPYISCDDDDDSSGYESFSGIYDKASVDIESTLASAEQNSSVSPAKPHVLPLPPPLKPSVNPPPPPPVKTTSAALPVFRMPGDPEPVPASKPPVSHPVYPTAASLPKVDAPAPPPPAPVRRSAPAKPSPPPPAPPAKPSRMARVSKASKGNVSSAPPPPPPPKPVAKSSGAPPPPPPPPPPAGRPAPNRGAPPPPPPPPPPVRR